MIFDVVQPNATSGVWEKICEVEISGKIMILHLCSLTLLIEG